MVEGLVLREFNQVVLAENKTTLHAADWITSVPDDFTNHLVSVLWRWLLWVIWLKGQYLFFLYPFASSLFLSVLFFSFPHTLSELEILFSI